MGIDISIVAGLDKSTSSVSASGSVQHVITKDEQLTFRLMDKQLKEAVKAYFGKSPNDAYLHSPTPWGDLYKTYYWEQVQTVLVVQSAEVVSITSQPVVIKTQEFENNSNNEGTFNVSISETVNNTATSSWNTGGALTIGQKFTYGVSFGADVKGETSIQYSQSWGVGGQQSESITVGSTSGVSVKLDPGESVIAELSASRGAMKVRLQYKAYLIGATAINYNPKYKEHHFWGLPIGHVMSAADISNSVVSSEDIDICYYSNSKVVLKDKQTGAVKASRSMSDMPGL